MGLLKFSGSTNDVEVAQARARRDAEIDIDAEAPSRSPTSDASSSTGEDDDDNWDEWASDAGADTLQCISLFDATTHVGVVTALAHDRDKHDVDFEALCKRLQLDFHARIRLVNYIRREHPKPAEVNALTGKEPLFTDDAFLQPVLVDDPLLLLETDDWSDEDVEEQTSGPDRKEALRRAAETRPELEGLLGGNVNATPMVAHSGQPAPSNDTGYFETYGDNEIHYIMLKDRVRTSTYASFIMNTPELFQDAVVLDVGCGTGILSMFAARAGARRVIAVDASPHIARKAEKNVCANELQDVITVIQGKIEDIQLPDGITQVDVIVSEWMGYALLYESMLDSVIVARDRFLKPPASPAELLRGREGSADDDVLKNSTEREKPNGGVMVPSQTRMLLGLCSATEVFKENVEFWSDVYGFDMAAMTEGVYDEAIVECVDADQILTESEIVLDIDTRTVRASQLSFSAPFELHGRAARRTVAHAFAVHFDAFFAPDGAQVPRVARALAVRDGEAVLAEVWRVGRNGSRSRAASPVSGAPPSSPFSSIASPVEGSGNASGDPRKDRLRRRSSVRPPKVASFTTGPQSIPTHWKQTLFLLKEPIVVHEDTVVTGTFHCRKSSEDFRALDVEIHYVVRDGDESATGEAKSPPMIVQSFKVQ